MPSDGMKFDWEGKLGRIVHSPKIDKGTSPEHPNSPSVVPCPSLGPSSPAEHTLKPNINQLDNEIDNLLFPKGQSQSPRVIKLRPHGGGVCHGGVGDQNQKLDNLNTTPKVKFLLFDDFITNEKWSSSLALPAPESKEEQAAGDISNPIGKALPSNQQDLALSDKSQSRQSSRADKKSTTSTFLTDIVEPNNPADLNDFELETSETVTAPLVSMGAALSQEAPNQESPSVSPAEATEEEATVFTENPPKSIPSSTLDQEAEVVGQPEEQSKERSADALLDNPKS